MSPQPGEPGERRTRSDDVLSVGTPNFVDLDDERSVEEWKRVATGIAKQFVWSQYRKPPFDLEFGLVEILITADPTEIDDFYASHIETCSSCREGVKVAKAYVTAGVDETATLVKIAVTEVW